MLSLHILQYSQLLHINSVPRVSWEEVLLDGNCADEIIVKYWPKDASLPPAATNNLYGNSVDLDLPHEEFQLKGGVRKGDGKWKWSPLSEVKCNVAGGCEEVKYSLAIV